MTARRFAAQRDNDIALAGSSTKACALWLEANPENRQRNLRWEIPIKIFTPERYEEVYKNTIAQSGLTAEWHGTPDGQVWGVKARVLPKGEYDAEDEQVDGVQEEDTIDSGNEEIIFLQGEIKFNSLANKIGEAGGKSAVYFAVSLAEEEERGGADHNASDDEDDEESSGSSDKCEHGRVF